MKYATLVSPEFYPAVLSPAAIVDARNRTPAHGKPTAFLSLHGNVFFHLMDKVLG